MAFRLKSGAQIHWKRWTNPLLALRVLCALWSCNQCTSLDGICRLVCECYVKSRFAHLHDIDFDEHLNFSSQRDITREMPQIGLYVHLVESSNSTTMWNNAQAGLNTFIRDLMVVCPSTKSIDNCPSKDGGP